MESFIQPGATVKTSYGTGPYLIEKIISGCVCSRDGAGAQSEPHLHAVCKGLSGNQKGSEYHIGGLREDGTSVWSEDLVFLVKPAEQMSFLF